MRKPSLVPTSCNPLEVVRKRKSTGMIDSNGAGQRSARPGSINTRTGLPNRVTTDANPARTCTRLAAINATLSRSTATSMRTQGNLPPVGRGPW